METNISFARQEYNAAIRQLGRRAVTVVWTEISGGARDPVTQAVVGGVQTFASGTLDGLGHEIQASRSQRQNVEMEVGDLLLDLTSAAVVTHASGTLNLTDLADRNPEFVWGGRYYVQKESGAGLATLYDVRIENVVIGRTLHLKRKP